MTVIDDIDELVEAISYCRTDKLYDLEPGVKAKPSKPPHPTEK